MTYRLITLHIPRPLLGLHMFEVGKRDYAPVMPFVALDHTGRRLAQQEFRPRPDIIRSALVIGPGITDQHALITWHWLGTNTRP